MYDMGKAEEKQTDQTRSLSVVKTHLSAGEIKGLSLYSHL